MKYYEINETQARQAKQMWSFSDYINGSETESYQKRVDETYEYTYRCGGNEEHVSIMRDIDEQQALRRLADYEEAEEEKRLIISPCKIGDKVYVNCDTWGNTWNFKTVLYGKYLIGEIIAIIKTKKQTLIKIQVEHNVSWKRERRRYPISAIGKTVFLDIKEIEESDRN